MSGEWEDITLRIKHDPKLPDTPASEIMYQGRRYVLVDHVGEAGREHFNDVHIAQRKMASYRTAEHGENCDCVACVTSENEVSRR